MIVRRRRRILAPLSRRAAAFLCNRAVARAGAAILVAAVCLAAGTAMATDCHDLPPSTLKIYGTEHDGLSAVAADMAEIDRVAAEHNIPEPMRHAPLLLMVPRLSSAFAVDERAVESPHPDGTPGVFCAAPASVELRMGITDYVVYIERSAYADECVRNRLLDHARRHLDADNRQLMAVVEQLRDPLADELTSLKATPAVSRDAAIARLKSGVVELLLQAVERFGQQRAQSHDEIDTPEVLAALRTACDGRMQTLESRVRRPGRET